MKINSRNKGSRAERNVAKILEEWTNKKFSRTPSSGGLGWHNRESISGDIVCTTEGHKFWFSVEVKNYREINFEHLLYLDNPKILVFWKQCLEDSEKAKKIPLLFLRYNGMPKDLYFVVIDYKFYRYTKKELGFVKYPGYLIYSNKLVILPSPLFFKWPYKKVRKLAKKYTNG